MQRLLNSRPSAKRTLPARPLKKPTDARALVVETDIGWNPDDIIAIWAVCMHTLRSRTRVLIISSDEMYPQNPRHQLIQRVVHAVLGDVQDLGWHEV